MRVTPAMSTSSAGTSGRRLRFETIRVARAAKSPGAVRAAIEAAVAARGEAIRWAINRVDNDRDELHVDAVYLEHERKAT